LGLLADGAAQGLCRVVSSPNPQEECDTGACDQGANDRAHADLFAVNPVTHRQNQDWGGRRQRLGDPCRNSG